ncbi:DUF4236 domain-containing protein [Corynebacterium sp. 320]|uniref:DUF4236 domain-containing protein n=1 Tax=Corynebacterium zhongnanshanii TaxID=2768834 RepID=A0ABQ6VEF6_9CORY|nr:MULTISPECIES: DUF4236 domain-containing protein [Corynebacterium]KAB1504322.1 DUF4236 domain-containing protein [Corynebacterium sp. 320]KAB1552578.1 DUF4236 domain-containing protein [Corynebacterium sp. 321]KAB1554204.1 DUF4236 domain-containing protein [Corynebacterium sp. 319]KAB3522817.1 DUF4236 domain-containing protein [Corynebacterium zhongnanshanii]KAB3528458.1 DUF4236 domain-containing protein [Corynebacterium sp. 250]
MGFGYRKTKKIGPFRFTASKSGVSSSVGVGPFRITRNARGKISTSSRTGIPGLSFRKQWK